MIGGLLVFTLFMAFCYVMLLGCIWALDCIGSRKLVRPPLREFWRMVTGAK